MDEAHAHDASFGGADLRGLRAPKADLRRSSFAGAKLPYADLSHARLEGCIMSDAELFMVNLHRARTDGMHTVGADLRLAEGTDPERAKAEDFTP